MVDEKAIQLAAWAACINAGHEPADWDGNEVLRARFLGYARSILQALSPGSTGETEGWRDIESAPKDGTWVFLFVPGHGPARARWNGRSWMSHTNARQITRGTHWRPLPAPPSAMLSAAGER